MNPDQIGKFIYQLRTEKKLSQYQLAEQIPISRQAVSKWERGETIPDSTTLVRLSEIFDVSINELLKGERIQKDSIKELEKTTLRLFDDRNQKRRQLKIFSALLLFMIFLFLSYYFINNYNSIHVYTIGGEGKNYTLSEGVFITTKEKFYLKLGKIKENSDNQITNIKVYYQKGNQERIIFEDKETDRMILNQYGYEEYIPYKDLKEIINHSYLEITNEKEETERISLHFKKDFNNTIFFWKKTRKGDQEELEEESINHLLKERNQIKENGTVYQNSYILEIEEYRFIDYENLEEILLEENGNIKWIYFYNKNQFSCMNPELKKEECEKEIKKDLEILFQGAGT